MGKFVNLSGSKHGKWSVIEYLGHEKYLCRCDCGTERTVDADSLRRGTSTSCGCNRMSIQGGDRFGRLTAVSYIEGSKWLCKCDCGNHVEVSTCFLVRGDTKSCGCAKADRCRAGLSVPKHGQYKTKLYSSWMSIKRRCKYPNCNGYSAYGGRGITICKEWKDSFETFMEWANSNGYKDGLTIERIDVNGDYEPSNCRWATNEEQQNNKRTSKFITMNGETHTIADWTRKIGVERTLIGARLKRGWSVERALTEKPHSRRKFEE